MRMLTTQQPLSLGAPGAPAIHKHALPCRWVGLAQERVRVLRHEGRKEEQEPLT